MEATTEALPEGEIAEISIFCHNLRDMDWFSKSDPFTVLFAYPSPRTPEAIDQLLDFQLACKTSTSSDPDRKSTVQSGDPAEWCCVGETEVVWNELSPAFVKKFYMPHGAEVHRAARLRFEVYDMDSDTGPLEKQDFLGATECTLPQLTQAHPRVRTMTLCDKKMKERPRYGKFTATAEVFRVMHPLHYLDISVVFCIGNEMPHQEQIFYVLSRRVHDTIEGNEPLWVRIHRSGALTPPPGHGTQEFGFQEMTISETQLTANDKERQLRIELFIHRNNGSHVRAGCTKPFSYADIELRRHDGLYEFIPDVGSGAGLQSGEMTVNTQIAGKKKSSSSLTGESGRVLSGSSACSSLLGSDCTLSLAGLDTSTIIFRFAKFAWNQSKSKRPGLMSLMKATKI